jgi:CheY-like chemotaxis protein
MGGEIGVNSVIGQGSTFWFTARLEIQSNPSPETQFELADLTNLHVLVVDDNETNRQIVHHQILGWRMHNGMASSGQEALAILRARAAAQRPYDLVILDMQMPGMDGLALARAIKSDPSISSVRIILLSSMGDQLSREELDQDGMDACLLKPVRQSHLFDSIANAAGRNATRETRIVPASAPLTFTVPNKEKVRILLAEDNSINQRVAIGQFNKLGCAVDVVGNGIEALEALKQFPYDVVFMDCMMPEMDGYEATRQIREGERTKNAIVGKNPHSYIVAMTANAMQGDREKCLEVGMDDYVAKPVRPRDLLEALERWRDHGRPQPPGKPTSTEPSDPSEDLVDFERLAELVDTPGEMASLVADYLEQSRELQKALQTAVEQRSAADITRIAHKWSGSSSTCGIKALTPHLISLEAAGKSGDLDGIEEKFKTTSQCFARVEAVLTTDPRVLHSL